MNFKFNKELFKELIKSNRLTQQKIADELNKRGQKITLDGVKSWTKNNLEVMPDFKKIGILGDIFKIDPIMLISENHYKDKDTVSVNDYTTINSQYDITLISQKASAGEGVEITDIEVFDTKQKISIDKVLFKTPQNGEDLRITQIDGHSMLPMLYPDNYVIFDITKNNYSGDGLYVILWRNVIMVKLLQISDVGNLEIISVNKDYKSYTINPDDQTVFRIAGKVVRVVM